MAGWNVLDGRSRSSHIISAIWKLEAFTRTDGKAFQDSVSSQMRTDQVWSDQLLVLVVAEGVAKLHSIQLHVQTNRYQFLRLFTILRNPKETESLALSSS